MRRALIAVAAMLVLEVAASFAIAFLSRPDPLNLLWLSLPPVAVALAAFPGWRGKLAGAFGLWLLVWPGTVLAEMTAHVFGMCLY